MQTVLVTGPTVMQKSLFFMSVVDIAVAMWNLVMTGCRGCDSVIQRSLMLACCSLKVVLYSLC